MMLWSSFRVHSTPSRVHRHVQSPTLSFLSHSNYPHPIQDVSSFHPIPRPIRTIRAVINISSIHPIPRSTWDILVPSKPSSPYHHFHGRHTHKNVPLSSREQAPSHTRQPLPWKNGRIRHDSPMTTPLLHQWRGVTPFSTAVPSSFSQRIPRETWSIAPPNTSTINSTWRRLQSDDNTAAFPSFPRCSGVRWR